jgi:hypothetical protein
MAAIASAQMITIFLCMPDEIGYLHIYLFRIVHFVQIVYQSVLIHFKAIDKDGKWNVIRLQQ